MSNKRKKGSEHCPRCKRKNIILTEHHERNKQYEVTSTIWLCRACHNKIHGIKNNCLRLN